VVFRDTFEVKIAFNKARKLFRKFLYFDLKNSEDVFESFNSNLIIAWI
jgi:hypothetical protein